MDASGFSWFTDFLKNLQGKGLSDAQPQGGMAPPNSPGGGLGGWSIPQDRQFDPSPDYDINLARQMVNRYISAGFDPRYAVGMAANSVQESGLNPNAYNKSEQAIGLFQYRHDRAQNLRDFAARQNSKYNDFMTQVDFSIYEKFHGEKGVINKIYNRNPETAADFAGLIDQYYERSAGTERNRRRNLATDMWRRFYGDKAYNGVNQVPDGNNLSAFFASGGGEQTTAQNPFDALFGGGQASGQESNFWKDLLAPTNWQPPAPPQMGGANVPIPAEKPQQGGNARTQNDIQAYLKNLADSGMPADRMVSDLVQMTGVNPEFAKQMVEQVAARKADPTNMSDPMDVASPMGPVSEGNIPGYRSGYTPAENAPFVPRNPNGGVLAAASQNYEGIGTVSPEQVRPADAAYDRPAGLEKKEANYPPYYDDGPKGPATRPQVKSRSVAATPQAMPEQSEPSVEPTPPSGGLPQTSAPTGGGGLNAIAAFLGSGPIGTIAKAGVNAGKAVASRFVSKRDPSAEVGSQDGQTAYEAAEKNIGITPPDLSVDLPDVPKPRRTYGEADSMRNEFRRLWVRDEGESDQEVRARRRGMLVQAGEVLQSISLGQKFDAGLGARMNIAERQQLYDQDMQYAQERRLQETLKYQVENQNFQNKLGLVQEDRARQQLTLAQAEFDWQRSSKLAEIGMNKQMQEDMAKWASENGYGKYADLIRAGGSGVAGQMILEEMKDRSGASKQGASAFRIEPSQRDAVMEMAKRGGNENIVDTVFQWETSPRAAEEAYKKILADAGPSEEALAAETSRLEGMIPVYLDPTTKDRLKAMAGQAARDSDFADDYTDAVEKAIENSPVEAVLKQIRDIAGKNYELGVQGAPGLETAAMNAIEFATNPAFKSSPLTGNVLVPIAKYLNSIPGLGETFKDLTGLNDVSIFGAQLMKSYNNGQLGNLAQGVTGQLSNLEGQLLLSILGDGRVTRTEIMALSQAMLKRAERASVARDAAFQYEQKVRNGEIDQPSTEAFKKYVDDAVFDKFGNTYERLDTQEDFAAYLKSKVAIAAEGAGMSPEEYLKQPEGKISRRLLSEVVMVPDPSSEAGYKLVPLFNNYLGGDYEFPTPEEPK